MDQAMVQPRFDADAETPDARRALHEQNRLSWNAATRAHNSHKADQAKFYREGGSKLYPEETALPATSPGSPSSTSSATPGRTRSR
jgi:hypothetical protein